VRNNSPETLPHETLASERLERVVTQVRRLEVSAHDLADVDHAGDCMCSRDDKKSLAIFAAKAFQVSIELAAVARWSDPAAMQVAATTSGAQEVRAMTWRGPFELQAKFSLASHRATERACRWRLASAKTNSATTTGTAAETLAASDTLAIRIRSLAQISRCCTEYNSPFAAKSAANAGSARERHTARRVR